MQVQAAADETSLPVLHVLMWPDKRVLFLLTQYVMISVDIYINKDCTITIRVRHTPRKCVCNKFIKKLIIIFVFDIKPKRPKS